VRREANELRLGGGLTHGDRGLSSRKGAVGKIGKHDRRRKFRTSCARRFEIRRVDDLNSERLGRSVDLGSEEQIPDQAECSRAIHNFTISSASQSA